jgi:hypothetical protein
MFCSPFKIFDDDDAFDFFSGPVTFTGRVRVEEPPTDEERDNDYWGFALGFNAGDAGPLDGGSGIDANYILIDWKRGDQRYSNSCREEDPEDGTCPRYPGYDPNEPPEEGENVPVPQCKPVQCQIRLDENDLPDEWNQATEGLAASQVLGLAHADLMWSHVVCPAEDNSQGDFSTGFIEELVRGRRFGNVGWEYYDTKEWYDFRFDISSDVIRVYVDDCENPELVIRARDLIGRNEFNNGHFCFYNYSQVSLKMFCYKRFITY